MIKGLVLQGKRTRFEVQKDSFCECGVRKGIRIGTAEAGDLRYLQFHN